MRPRVAARGHRECLVPVLPSRRSPCSHPSFRSRLYPRATTQRTSLPTQGHAVMDESGDFFEDAPLDLEYENIGAGWARLAWTLPPVPIGPAVALMLPPMVTFPPRENARTASSLLRRITKSVMSAPIW